MGGPFLVPAKSVDVPQISHFSKGDTYNLEYYQVVKILLGWYDLCRY